MSVPNLFSFLWLIFLIQIARKYQFQRQLIGTRRKPDTHARFDVDTLDGMIRHEINLLGLVVQGIDLMSAP